MKPFDDKELFKLDDIKSFFNAPIPYNSAEKYKVLEPITNISYKQNINQNKNISSDINPNQNPSKAFFEMIKLAAFMFDKMEKRDAAQRNYRAAYNPSMN